MEPITPSKFRPVLSNVMRPPSGGQINFFKTAILGRSVAKYNEDMALLSMSEITALYNDAMKYGFKQAREHPEWTDIATTKVNPNA